MPTFRNPRKVGQPISWWRTEKKSKVRQPPITETPSYPLTVFFRPNGTYGIQLTNSGKNLFNESVFFHEALHGATGQGDSNLQSAFGYKGLQPSSVISSYIQSHILSICPVNLQ